MKSLEQNIKGKYKIISVLFKKEILELKFKDGVYEDFR